MSQLQCHRDKFVYTCCSANKVTWRLWGTVLHCAAASAAGSCCGCCSPGSFGTKGRIASCVEHANIAIHTHTHTNTRRKYIADFPLSVSHTCWQGVASWWVLKYLKLKSAAFLVWRRKWTISRSWADLPGIPHRGWPMWNRYLIISSETVFFLSIHKIKLWPSCKRVIFENTPRVDIL